MKTIVITGSTRGIGLGMAEEFLRRGHQVGVSGRKAAEVEQLVADLGTRYPSERIFGQACDVTDFDQVQALWDANKAHFGQVDIWISNAGQAHPLMDLWELPTDLIESIVKVNLVGQFYNVKAVIKGMLEQGSGAFFMVEGQGASGRIVEGLSLYGASKRGSNFLFDGLVAELKDKPVIAGSIQPGVVLTDLLLGQGQDDPEAWERSKKVFNILAEKVETVVPRIVDQVLAARKNGTRINLMSAGKIIWRFLTAGISKRDLFAEEE